MNKCINIDKISNELSTEQTHNCIITTNEIVGRNIFNVQVRVVTICRKVVDNVESSSEDFHCQKKVTLGFNCFKSTIFFR